MSTTPLPAEHEAPDAGTPPAGPQRWVDTAYELVSSMRFAIALFTLICIASIIGTVVKQGEPYSNYVNQFGPFWADVYRRAGLYTIYSTVWFLLILAFLVASTSLCIARNLPKILVDLKQFKEGMREQSLNAFHHKAVGVRNEAASQVYPKVAAWLQAQGWRAKVQARDNGTMIAARKGSANKIGYLAAHSAIVLICLGGLLDGDLMLRAQMLLQGKSSYAGGGMVRDVPEQHRLSVNNPTYRANLLVAEGSRANMAVVNLADGVVLQALPFDVELRKFNVEYYSTGMPKLFSSDVVIHDHDSGKATPATIKVNEPATYRGITLYQSSFDDGGSKVKLHALPLQGGAPFDVEGVIGGATRLTNEASGGKDHLTLEFTGLRVINVENLGQPEGSGTDVRKVDLAEALQNHMGSGAKTNGQKELHNVGPSISYKLRDASGQAREFNNYQQPVDLDGQRVFLAGVRDTPGEPFRYLRIPADENDSITTWYALRAALSDPAMREEAAKRYAAADTPAGRPDMGSQLLVTARTALALFAGEGSATPAEALAAAGAASSPNAAGAGKTGGLQAIANHIEAKVPQTDRQRVSQVLLRVLHGSLFELTNLARVKAGLPALDRQAEGTRGFINLEVMSLSDSFFYPAPMLLTLSEFTQVQASVLQVTRTPGKTLVYLGAILLIIGVFAMLYIRERRLWIWLQATPEGSSTRIQLALSSTRRTLDTDTEFNTLRAALLPQPPAA